MRQLTLFLLVGFLIFCIALNFQLSRFFLQRRKHKQTPIKKEIHTEHRTREGFEGEPHRVYIILGGSGFTGSWFARYLLLRKENNVLLFDKRPPPADLAHHGAKHVKIDLTNILAVESAFRDVAMSYRLDISKVIIYNCSCARRYDEPRITSVIDPGLRIAEVVMGNLKEFPPKSTVLINVGDTMSHRLPVRWWKFWDTQNWLQHSRSDTAPIIPWGNQKKSQAFSVYAWYQGAIESGIRSYPWTVSGAIRTEGFISGHIGDHVLTPALTFGAALLHSPGVPISFVHVEDVVRAGLALEYLLLDPDTKEQYDTCVFTVGNGAVTTLEEVYQYIRTRRSSFKTIKVLPVVAYLVGWFFSFASLFLAPVSPEEPDEATNILCGGPKTLTLARFSTLNIGQLPNKANSKRTMEVLKLHPNFSLSQIIDSVIDELETFEKQRLEKQRKLKRATNDDLVSRKSE